MNTSILTRLCLAGLVLLGSACERATPRAPATSLTTTTNTAAAPDARGGAVLTAQQIVADPARLHALLRARNPYYQDEAQFEINPDLGLVGEITEAAVVDLSPLKGIAFGALDLRATPVSDLAPLAGMPLKLLGLEQTRVSDLSPLKGMPLAKLYLNQTSVRDLTPLKGLPLTELMLVGTKVEDLEPLRGAPLEGLWLNQTPVTNIAALAQSPLITLTLEGTRVSDLRPLAGVKTLQRLHIGGAPVQDLAPLSGLALTRLIFNPARVTNGLAVARQMTTLRELGATLEDRMDPEAFWKLWDSGGLK